MDAKLHLLFCFRYLIDLLLCCSSCSSGYQNVIQVTVSGTVGKWWSTPHTDHQVRYCCPKEVKECFITATTRSFGSICYGSLLVGVIQFVRQFAEPIRPKDSPSLLAINECMLPLQRFFFSWIDSLVLRFNQWSFTYIGLYNYDFMESGKRGTELLEIRGWTNIATDDLLNNVLNIFSLVIGGCAGCFGILIERIDEYQLASVSNPTAVAFG